MAEQTVTIYCDEHGRPLTDRQQLVMRDVMAVCNLRRGKWLRPGDIWPHPDSWSDARRATVVWLGEIGALARAGIEVKREGRNVLFRLPPECEETGRSSG
jgi:hypothetical protein